jgi:hypothetical protein
MSAPARGRARGQRSGSSDGGTACTTPRATFTPLARMLRRSSGRQAGIVVVCSATAGRKSGRGGRDAGEKSVAPAVAVGRRSARKAGLDKVGRVRNLGRRSWEDSIKPTKLGILVWLACLVAKASAMDLPEIRSGLDNEVPNCVRSADLMAFVNNRNRELRPPRRINPRFSQIADVYRRIGVCVQKVEGKCVGVRWDFAFFQTLIETNYLIFRKPDGSPSGVSPEDNNFAGLGATVPGKPGERFKDIETGVLAHLQHVVMYSGEKVLNPVAQRTRAVESYIIAKMNKLGRPVTFADLVTEWTGTDRSTYSSDIQRTATRFADMYCS